ncbi:FAD-dependent oxidoreductase [Actinokineospora bangkokensis]|uniref:FAD-dependent oxidoreductase n=1 Tax=Actinokineospora bangkokensis TaxID=1193682 RepID=A0A1Q9LN29_9PSEU|nr:FAD-dependent oxidoreductase [Actinokineospora bangkokensis]
MAGAAAAGISAAETLRREGFDGTITLVDPERHQPYDRPPLSKQVLDGTWPVERIALRGPDRLVDLGLDLRLGTAAAGLDVANRVLALDDGTELGFDGLVIATGVRPRGLPGGGGAHVLRTLDDALALRARLTPGARLVVVGAGFLGTEVAAAARVLGAEVTLVEPTPVPLAPVVGEQVGAFLAHMHQERGVDLRLGVGVAEFLRRGDAISGVRLTDGSHVPADDVLVAIGSHPNTEWLADSGLTVTDGVVCDEFTAAAPGVHAAGDVARWHNPLFGTDMRVEHRTNAAEQAVAAARNLLHPGAPKPFAPIPYFWSDQYDLKVRAFGALRGHDEARVVAGGFDGGGVLVAYRTGDTVTGALSISMPPKALHRWRAAIAARTDWARATSDPSPA